MVDKPSFISDPPVTVTIIRHVKPGKEAAFEKLACQISEAAAQAKGYLGDNLFRPQNGSQEYRVIYKFDCISHYHHWETSEIRNNYYAEILPLLLDTPQVKLFTGLETWFELPGQGAVVPAPRYKMMIVSWLAIYPLVVVILECLNPVLRTLPIPMRALIITLIAIPSMTYILMPRMSKWFSKWLYPKIPNNISMH